MYFNNKIMNTINTDKCDYKVQYNNPIYSNSIS